MTPADGCCRWCGASFEPAPGKVFCCRRCKEKASSKRRYSGPATAEGHGIVLAARRAVRIAQAARRGLS